MHSLRYFFVLLFVLSLAVSAQSVITPKLQQELDNPRLQSELIPVAIALDKQFSVDEMEVAMEDFSCETLMRALQDLTSREQQPLIAYCEKLAQDHPQEIADLRPIWIVNVVTLSATPATIQELARLPYVATISLDRPVQVLSPIAAEEDREIPPYGLLKIGADKVWPRYKGKGVTVAVLDTGVYRHDDLKARMVPGKSYIAGVPDANDDHGHGTHCAGTIAGDKTGVAPEANIMPVKVLNSGGSGKQSDVWDAIGWAVQNGAKVMSLSIGWIPSWMSLPGDADQWKRAVENATSLGALMVIAAGNEGTSGLRYPGAVRAALTIGATDANDAIASFSSRGPVQWKGTGGGTWNKPNVCAPGVNVYSTRAGGGYTTMSGTSMATPHTAGAVALILSAKPNLQPTDVIHLLQTTPYWNAAWGPRPTIEPNNTYGFGRIDVAKAVDRILGVEMQEATAADDREVIESDKTFYFHPDQRVLYFDPPAGARVTGRTVTVTHTQNVRTYLIWHETLSNNTVKVYLRFVWPKRPGKDWGISGTVKIKYQK